MSNESRSILRAGAIVGGVSVLTILVGLVRTKTIALFLGPEGIGFLGLMGTVLGVAGTLAGLGLGTSGVRQIAAAQGDQAVLDRVRYALVSLSVLVGMLGGAGLFFLRAHVSQWVFESPDYSTEIGWIAIAVFFTPLASSQMATLQGMRRIGDMARARLTGAILTTLLGILVIWWLRLDGVVVLIVLGPVLTFLVAAFFARKLPKPQTGMALAGLPREWWFLIKLGAVFMLGALVTSAGQTVIRSMIVQEIDLAAAGYFHASWLISTQYIGLILGAMGTDYLPRLTSIISDRVQANSLIATQAEIVLLLAGPCIIAMAGLAPLAISLLYSSEFTPASEILRWQTLGNVFRIASWPLSFIMIAQGRGAVYTGMNILWTGMLVGGTWMLLPMIGVVSTGVTFAIASVIQFIVYLWLSAWLIGYRFDRLIKVLIMVLVVIVGGIVLLSYLSEIAAVATSLVLAFSMAVYSVHRLHDQVGSEGRLGKILQTASRVTEPVHAFIFRTKA